MTGVPRGKPGRVVASAAAGGGAGAAASAASTPMAQVAARPEAGGSKAFDRPRRARPGGISDLLGHGPLEFRWQAVHDRHRRADLDAARQVDDVTVEHAKTAR